MNAMKTYNDKDRIGFWLRLYNRRIGGSYVVESWPDDDSSKKNIDALCRNAEGGTLALEHTLIEPFAGDKADAHPFLKTLGSLENHPTLIQKGHMITVSQEVGAVPRGINWDEVPKEMLAQLAPVLPGLANGGHLITVKGPGWALDLRLHKSRMSPEDPGTFMTGRLYPGDPGPELIIAALDKKIPKLAAATADKKILLLEKDAAAGTIEAQYELLPDEPRIRTLLNSVDEIWAMNSMALERENVIFTTQIHPSTCQYDGYCSLELSTDKYWQVQR